MLLNSKIKCKQMTIVYLPIMYIMNNFYY